MLDYKRRIKNLERENEAQKGSQTPSPEEAEQLKYIILIRKKLADEEQKNKVLDSMLRKTVAGIFEAIGEPQSIPQDIGMEEIDNLKLTIERYVKKEYNEEFVHKNQGEDEKAAVRDTLIDELRKQVEDLKQSSEERLNVQLENLRLSLASDHQQSSSHLLSQIEKLTGELEEKKAQIERYEDDIISLNKLTHLKIEELEAKIKDNEEASDQSRASMEALISLKEEKEAVLTDKLREKESVIREQSLQISRLVDLEGLVVELRSKSEQLTQENENLRSQVDRLVEVEGREAEARAMISEMSTQVNLIQQLSRELDDIREREVHLQSETNQLKSENSKLQIDSERLIELQNHIKSILDENERLKMQIVDLELIASSLIDLEVREKKALEKIDDLNRQVSSLLEEVSVKDGQLKEQIVAIDSMKMRIDDLQIRLQQADSLRAALEKEKMQMEENFRLSEEQSITRSKADREVLMSQHQGKVLELTSELSKAHQTREASMATHISERTKMTEEFSAKMKAILEELESERRDKIAKTEKLEASQQECSAKTTQISQIQAELAEQEKVILSLRHEIESLRSALEVKEDDYIQMESEVDTLREIVKTREVQMAQQREREEQAIEQSDHTKIKLAELNKENEELLKELDQIRARCSSLESTCSNMQEQLLKSEDQVLNHRHSYEKMSTEMKSKLEEMSLEKEELGKRISDRDQAMSELQARLDGYEKLAKDRAEAIALLSERLETIETEKKEAIREKENCLKDLADRGKEVVRLKAKVDEVTSDREKQRQDSLTEIRELKSKTKEVTDDYESTLESQRSTILILEQSLMTMKSQVADHTHNADREKEHRDELEATILKKEAEIMKLKHELVIKQEENARTIDQVESIRRDLEECRGLLDQSNEEQNTQASVIRSQVDQIESLTSLVANLNVKIDEQTRCLEQCHAEFESQKQSFVKDFAKKEQTIKQEYEEKVKEAESMLEKENVKWQNQKETLERQLREVVISKDLERTESLNIQEDSYQQQIEKIRRESRDQLQIQAEEINKKWENDFKEMIKSKESKLEELQEGYKEELKIELAKLSRDLTQGHEEKLKAEVELVSRKLTSEHKLELNARVKEMDDLLQAANHQAEVSLSELATSKAQAIELLESQVASYQLSLTQLRSEYEKCEGQMASDLREQQETIEKLTAEIAAQKLDLINSSCDITRLQEALEQKSTDIDRLLAEEKAMKKEAEIGRDDKQRLEKLVQELREDKGQLESNLILAREEIESLTNQNNILNSTLEEAITARDQWKASASKLESKVAALNQSIDELRNRSAEEILDLKSLERSLNLQVIDLNAQIRDLSGQLDTLMKQKATVESKLDSSEMEKASKDQVVAKLESKIIEKSREITALKNNVDILSQEKSQAESLIEGFKSEVKQHESTISKMQVDISDLTTTIIARDKSIERLEAELERTKESVRAARETESNSLQKEIRQLQEKLEAVISESNAASDISSNLVAELQSVKKLNEEIKKEEQNLRIQLADRDKLLEQRAALIEGLNRRIEEVTNESNSKVEELSQKLRSDLADFKKQSESLKKEHEEVINGLRKEEQSLTIQLESMTANFTNTSKEVLALQKALQTTESKVRETEQYIEELKNLLREKDEQHQSVLSLKQQAVNTLEASLSRLTNDNSALRDKVKSAETEIQRETERRRQNEDELRKEISRRDNDSSSELKALKTRLEEECRKRLESSREESDLERVRLEERNGKLMKEIDSLKIKVNEKDSEASFLKSNLQSNVETKDKEIAVLRKQIEENARGMADLKVTLSKAKSLIVQLEADLKAKDETSGKYELQLKEKSLELEEMKKILTSETAKAKEEVEKYKIKSENDLLEANLRADKTNMMNNTLRKQFENTQAELEETLKELTNLRKSATAGNSVQNEKDLLIEKLKADLMRVGRPYIGNGEVQRTGARE
jgi:chromosome segregation ATPase